MREFTEVIFENYGSFLKDYSRDLGSPSGVVEMLSSQGAFDAYIQALTDGLPAQQKVIVEGVCRREREVLLEESVNVGPSASAISYAVSFFPILTDIYSDPVISQICTVYPYDKPTLTIPRIYTEGSVMDFSGNTQKYRLPDNRRLMRGLTKNLTLSLTNNYVSDDLYTALAAASSGIAAAEITPDKIKINQHTFYISGLTVTDTSGVPVYVNSTVVANVRVDARGQLKASVPFTMATVAVGGTAATGVIGILGNVDFETGAIQVNCTVTTTASNIKVFSITTPITVNATRGQIGRVKVDLKSEGKDYFIDVREDFEIGLFTERMQDYKAIYNLDLVRTLSDVIKTQVLLNKDQDLAGFLKAYEADMQTNGSFAKLDLARYDDRGEFTPSNILDVFKSIIPIVSMVARKIKTNYRAEPQYMLAGQKTAVMLEALQQYGTNWSDNEHGTAGFAQGMGGMAFRKMTVLSTPAIPDDMIYLIYKAPSDDLGRSTIVDITYKPLYIIEELTNTEKRTYVRTRSIMDVVNANGLGAIQLVDTAGASTAGNFSYFGDFN